MSYEVVESGPAAPTGLGLRSAARAGVVEDPDRELVLRWQGGDESAFEVLVERHKRRVFRLLMRMMGSREEAEDVSQAFPLLYKLEMLREAPPVPPGRHVILISTKDR